MDPADAKLEDIVFGVIARIQEMTINKTTAAPPPPPSTSLLDCDHLVREEPVPHPFTTPDVWPLGRLQDERVLVCALSERETLLTSIFNFRTRKWSAPVESTPAHHVSFAELLFARTASQSNSFVMCSADHAYVASVDENGAVLQHHFELPSRPVSLAVAPDGELFALIVDEGHELILYHRCGRVLVRQRSESVRATMLAFDPASSLLAMVNGENNQIGIFRVMATADIYRLVPLDVISGVPSSAALLQREAVAGKGLLHDVVEQAEWLHFTANSFVLATRHHLCSNECAILDTASATGVLCTDDVFVMLDAAGMVSVADREWELRHQIPPETRGALRKPTEQSCACEFCIYRSLHPVSNVMQPVMGLSPDGRTLIVVDQWAMVRIASASLSGRIRDDK